ncbi:MAG: gamma-glutamyltransferase [Polyangiales bacterium]
MRRTPGRAQRQVLPLVFLLAGCGTAVATLPKPAAPKPAKKTLAPEVQGSKFAVATENGEASRIAMEVLKKGGDAVDAAAAAAFALGVATPTACGIGGGGFAVVYRAKTKEAFVLDFREVAPAGIDVAALDRRPLATNERGHLVGVPGEVQGLAQLVAKYGKKSLRDDMAPAIALARNGFSMTDHVRRVSEKMSAKLQSEAPLLAVKLLGAGGPLPSGTKIVRAELADTLQAIADRGPKALYEGPIAEAAVAAVKEAGGTLTMDDLAKYAPKPRTALRFKVGNREVITMPTPSAGGVMLAQALRAQEAMAKKDGKGLATYTLGSGPYLHVVAELMRGSLDDRARFLGDPEQVPADLNALIDEKRMATRVAMIDPGKTHKPAELRVEEHGTSHISIIDAEGNAVALTTTVNGPFGARIVTNGFLMNDEMGDFEKTPDAIGNKPNIPRPGARPTSSMTPTIVLENGLPVMIIGGSGGYRIATSVTLASLAYFVFGASPGDAIGLPRIHVWNAKLAVEPGITAEIQADLKSRGEDVNPMDPMNAVQMIAIDRSSGVSIFAASDPRKGGVALAE